MKICAAQIQPVKGNIKKNISNHIQFIELAIEQQVDAIFFPELSLTGYEPSLAKELAINFEDDCLNIFQKTSNQNQITIGVGIPTKKENETKPNISMVIFQPNLPRSIYSKQYLHIDELPYFIEGKTSFLFPLKNAKIAPAICFESLLPEHAKQSFQQGANIYIASVAKGLKNIKKANQHYPSIASKYSMTVLMANAIGQNDNFICHGCSSIWDENGQMVERLDENSEGLLIYDTVSKSANIIFTKSK